MAVSQDLATGLCGGFNSLYFLLYALRQAVTPRRRIGAAALALVNGGALVESIYLLALYLSLRWGWSAQTLLCAPGPWLLARVLPFTGTAFVTLLILRSRNRRAGED
jgi:peptidoglycan biosynthesis protein MviN/MurJ (putative lipid II flippase)